MSKEFVKGREVVRGKFSRNEEETLKMRYEKWLAVCFDATDSHRHVYPKPTFLDERLPLSNQPARMH